MTGDCQSCRWWGRDENGQPNDGDPGLSLRVTTDSEPLPAGTAEREAHWDRLEQIAHSVEALYHLCHAIPQAWDWEDDVAAGPPLALCRDGSEYVAEVWTRAEFGCRLWEPVGAGHE